MLDTKYVSFSAAGTRGIAYFGVLDALEDQHGCEEFERWRRALAGFAGTSAGAIAALMLCVGLDRASRDKVLTQCSDIRRLLNPNVALLAQGFGVEEGHGLRKAVRFILTLGGLSETCTFLDVRRLLNVDLVLCATDLNDGMPYLMSVDRTPDVSVVEAVFASCCVPFVFMPPVINGVLLSDGCLSCDYPNVFQEGETLFISMCEGGNRKERGIHSWTEFIAALVRCANVAQRHKWQSLSSAYSKHTLMVQPLGEVLHLRGFSLHQTEEESKLLAQNGYACAIDFCYDGACSRVVADVIKLIASSVPPCESIPRAA